MTIGEMQDMLEAVQNELQIISETANAVEASLSEGILTSDSITWALIGIIRSINKSAKDVGALVDGITEVKGVLEKL